MHQLEERHEAEPASATGQEEPPRQSRARPFQESRHRQPQHREPVLHLQTTEDLQAQTAAQGHRSAHLRHSLQEAAEVRLQASAEAVLRPATAEAARHPVQATIEAVRQEVLHQVIAEAHHHRAEATAEVHPAAVIEDNTT